MCGLIVQLSCFTFKRFISVQSAASALSPLCPSCHVRTGQNRQDVEGCWKGKFRCRLWKQLFFPTCQVRVVRFYVNSRASSFSSFSFSASRPPPRTSTTTSHAQCSLPDLNHDQPRPVFAAGPQPRPSTPSVRCRTSTTTSHAQCSLPDLNHDQPRPVFAAGPQPRPATPSVRCRTSTTTIHAQCSLPDLNHDHPRPIAR